MINKKILGIYLERDSLHYLSMVNRFSGYTLKSLEDGNSPYDIKHGSSSYQLLRSFLLELPFDSSRSIFLALSRSEVFIREITLPSMPVEDAIMSIKNSLAIYSHLSPDSTYYDVIISEKNGGSFNALLVYAAKDEIEKYRKIFSETGHLASLKAIFPISYGICALLDYDNSTNGSLFSLVQGDTLEIFGRSGRTLIFSVSSPVDADDEKEMVLTSAQNRFPQFSNAIVDLNSDLIALKKGKKNRHTANLPPLKTNYASAAVAPFITKIQQISLDEEPVKINIFNPFRYILPFLALLIVILYFITDSINTKNIEAQSQLSEISSQIKALEGELEPLQNKIDTLKKASRFKSDVKSFMQTRPPLYTLINEIAALVPDGTWFANFTFNNNTITLRGTGVDALKTVELLRSSNLFSNVMLRGSVNRRPNGDENFTLVIELKSEEADKSGAESAEKKMENMRGL
ncbi:MAG: PilN domain-containing protein [Desulfamplus sp.]|nr:PilN domain-containing protein [Desulfamplus sp.]